MSWTEIDKNDNDSHELYVKFLDILKGMTENYSKNLSTKILYDINHKDTARSFVYIDGETEMCLSISIKNNGKLKVLTTGISEETPINIAVGIFCNKLKEVLLQNKLTTAYGVWEVSAYSKGKEYYEAISSAEVNKYGFNVVSVEDMSDKDKITVLQLK